MKFKIIGEEGTKAADELSVALVPLVPTRTSQTLPATEPHRDLDPVALTALILTIPSAVLAVLDLTERLAKRKKAAELVETMQRIQRETRVVILVIAPDGTELSADTLDPDRLLEIANRPGPTP